MLSRQDYTRLDLRLVSWLGTPPSQPAGVGAGVGGAGGGVWRPSTSRPRLRRRRRLQWAARPRADIQTQSAVQAREYSKWRRPSPRPGPWQRLPGRINPSPPCRQSVALPRKTRRRLAPAARRGHMPPPAPPPSSPAAPPRPAAAAAAASSTSGPRSRPDATPGPARLPPRARRANDLERAIACNLQQKNWENSIDRHRQLWYN